MNLKRVVLCLTLRTDAYYHQMRRPAALTGYTVPKLRVYAVLVSSPAF